MILAAICDDSQYDRLQIKNFITDYSVKEGFDISTNSFDSGDALIKYYVNGYTAFDIIFLDIYMNGKNGIMTAKQIREYDTECKIIFTTSSADHALESFDVFPFNYLTKPLLKTVFNLILEKAINTINKEKQKILSLKIGSGIQTINYNSILFIESIGKTLKIHSVQNKEYKLISKLDDIQTQINDKRFIRCHKSFLVNMDHILSLEGYCFRLTSNVQVAVTQRNFANIKKAFFDYLLSKSNL